MDAHLNIVLRLVVVAAYCWFLCVKITSLTGTCWRSRQFLAKKRKRGSADDPICHSFGDFVVVIVENGPENLCRFRKTNPCPRCKRGDDSK